MFFLKKRIICPYCLTETKSRQPIKKCSNIECEYGDDLPRQYVQKYEEAPPLFIQIVGATSVGKTTYLQALTLMLMQANKLLGANYAYSPLTSSTLEYVRNVRKFVKSKQLPSSPTPIGPQIPYMMLLLKLDRWKSRTLVLSDVAGEIFQNFEFSLEYAPYIMRDTTLLMIGLDDLQKDDMEMDDLMSSYIQTVVRNGNQKRNKTRKVVVVLSKADKIFDELPSELQKYLKNDPMLVLFETSKSTESPLGHDGMKKYMQKLNDTNKAIKRWLTKKYRSGQNLCGLAAANDIDLRFSLISSTGLKETTQSPDNSQGRNNDIKPVRVLDPFFWLLELER